MKISDKAKRFINNALEKDLLRILDDPDAYGFFDEDYYYDMDDVQLLADVEKLKKEINKFILNNI